ncbi:hypothetical protein ASPCADRAFT_160688 [Aspergillus carbonarius ITEM 5010]|uniref:Rad4 beta-hairpin domain-containing protein n=1 Tax=Aspergillus carbonarius (strain ITEM 5010) TaxID=602072 RepID=A0A1R3RYP7_ASPC5|nr:hypothetical protein ASPCADRAFT_160688 [Aspergillus carbonarius ITEM 5010]
MPPYVPRKRLSSEDPPAAKRHHATPSIAAVVPDTDSEFSLSDVPEETPPVQNGSDEDSSDSDEVDWEDAIESNPASATPMTPSILTHDQHQDLELTLDKNEIHLSDLLEGKKGPSKIERQIRIQTHCLHVQFLLHHNAIRNAWANDSQVHEILRRKLLPAIRQEVKKWRIASGLEVLEQPPVKKSKKGKGKQRRQSDRDWAEGSSRMEPGKPDMSGGDPIILLLKVLAAYWKSQFKITAPGLRKQGYRPMAQLEAQITSLHKDDHDPGKHGERIADIGEFRHAAENMQGSRDVGAQLFTALLRALDIEARLVASLQPLGFGWTKAETYTTKPRADTVPSTENAETEDAVDSESDSSQDAAQSTRHKKSSGYDKDLPFPIYWTEVASPITHQIIPVDPLVLRNPVATTPDLQAAFEPRGVKAERAKQVICYVIAFSADKTAKDVTTRYLRRRTWPGKTKGYRMPVEKIPVPGRKGKFYEIDWFRVIFRVYQRAPPQRTAVDDIEEANDLLPNQPERKSVKEGDTLQSLRASTEFVLERFFRREEALKPGAQHVRTFTTGKGAKAKEEKVFRRKDVLKCQSAESWHKEGRQIKTGEIPLKHVPIRAVTLLRKREVDEFERENGQKPKQGLYAKPQTEYIIPPPIRDGIIPKNDYGNIDCFVPSMVPRGAAHIPWPGTVRVCKKLGIDYAEAVTGFEFGSKMAVPVIQGVVVAVENEDLVKDAWRADDAEKRKREQRKAEARILQTWRKFLFGLRIAQRVREEYGDSGEHERDVHNPFTNRREKFPTSTSAPRPEENDADPTHQGGGFILPDEEENDPADHGGGFLLPGEDNDPADQGGGFLLPGENDDDDGGLIVDHHEHHQRPNSPQIQTINAKVDDTDDDPISLSSDSEALSSPIEIPDSEGSEPEYVPPTTRRRTRRGGG